MEEEKKEEKLEVQTTFEENSIEDFNEDCEEYIEEVNGGDVDETTNNITSEE